MSPKAMATITRHDDGTLTYQISDPDDTGIAEITVEALTGLFQMAGIERGEDA